MKGKLAGLWIKGCSPEGEVDGFGWIGRTRDVLATGLDGKKLFLPRVFFAGENWDRVPFFLDTSSVVSKSEVR
jgi:hypothetical protein